MSSSHTRFRIKHIVATTALALALGVAPAAADTPAEAPENGKAKVKTLVFGEGSDIEGGVVGPDGEQVEARGRVLHSNLIRVRSDFIPEIFKSTENL